MGSPAMSRNLIRTRPVCSPSTRGLPVCYARPAISSRRVTRLAHAEGLSRAQDGRAVSALRHRCGVIQYHEHLVDCLIFGFLDDPIVSMVEPIRSPHARDRNLPSGSSFATAN